MTDGGRQTVGWAKRSVPTFGLSRWARRAERAFAHPTVCPPHPSRSGALTQPGQDLETGITVGGSHADFFLEIPHRALGVAADPAIAPVGVEAEPGEADLQFLHLGKRHQPFAAWERMHERAIAANAVGEMYDRKRVGKCRVVAHHGGKILSDQKRRAAINRH